VEQGETKAGRHASWLELFFDLVVVSAVAQLAHLIHPSDEHRVTAGQVLLFAGLYYAVWSVWTSFTLYANVAAEKTRQRSMLIAMFGLAVMAASVTRIVGENGIDLAGQGATAFAVAYVACRVLSSLSWGRTGSVVTSWPAAQRGAGLLPWVISIPWANARFALWALGIALDVGISYLQSRHPEQMIEEARRDAERRQAQIEARVSASRRPREQPLPFITPHPAHVDVAHLAERLGLFVIIVLGEAVAQVVIAAGEQPEWTAALRNASIAGFGLLVCIYWLTLEYGPTAVPGSVVERAAQLTMPAHYTMTCGIAAIAAGLGALAEHADEPLTEAGRWILCGGMVAYFLASAVLGLLARARPVWLLGWAMPSVAVPVLLAVFGRAVPGWWLVTILLLVALWLTLYPRIMASPARGSGEDAVDDQ
jgi:low temperature requirement protein LtrA